MATDGNDDLVLAEGTCVGDDMRGVLAGNLERNASAALKHVRMALAQLKKFMRKGLLDAAVAPVRGEIGPRNLACRLHPLARGEIDRTAVVGIDQRKIPAFGALIEIGHAGQQALKRELRQTVERAEQGGPPREGVETGEKFGRNGRVEQLVHKSLERLLIIGMRIGPAGLVLAFTCSFKCISLHALAEILVGA